MSIKEKIELDIQAANNDLLSAINDQLISYNKQMVKENFRNKKNFNR